MEKIKLVKIQGALWSYINRNGLVFNQRGDQYETDNRGEIPIVFKASDVEVVASFDCKDYITGDVRAAEIARLRKYFISDVEDLIIKFKKDTGADVDVINIKKTNIGGTGIIAVAVDIHTSI